MHSVEEPVTNSQKLLEEDIEQIVQPMVLVQEWTVDCTVATLNTLLSSSSSESSSSSDFDSSTQSSIISSSSTSSLFLSSSSSSTSSLSCSSIDELGVNKLHRTSIKDFVELTIPSYSAVEFRKHFRLSRQSANDVIRFWLQNGMYTEIPDVVFKHKYFLLTESREDTNSVICSTFRAYKENEISDSCTITKVQELDVNKDGLNDVLKIELRFFSKFPTHFMRLLLFFNYELKKRTKLAMEAMTLLHYSIPLDVQTVSIVGDLRLNQKQLLRNYGARDIYNHSVNMNSQSLFQLLENNAGRKFTTKIENDALTWETGFSTEKETVIRVELFYSEEVIHYQLDFWEEFKWAWIQYSAFVFACVYGGKYLIKHIFINRYVRSFVISARDEQ